MLSRFCRLGLVFAAVLAVACEDEPPPSASVRDAGGADLGLQQQKDASDDGIDVGFNTPDGSTTADAGVDAGPSTNDATVVADGGSTTNDGGTTSNDGSVSTADGGVTIVDGAVVLPDAGVLSMMPPLASVELGSTQSFAVGATAGALAAWTVELVPNGNPTLGVITPAPSDSRNAEYAAPRSSARLPVTYRVRAVTPEGIGTSLLTLVAPAPTVISVAPPSVDEGSQGVTVTITGTGFTSQTIVELDGVRLQSTFVGWTTVTADLPASLLTVPGERRLIVRNPAPGGGTAAITFPVILRRTIILPGAPPAAPGLFDAAGVGTDPSRLPTVTYPEDGSVAPLDFPSPVVSWDQPAPSNVCRLRIRGPAVAVDVYASTQIPLPTDQNPSAAIEAMLWRTIIGTAFDDLHLTYDVACAEVALTGNGDLAIVDGMIYPSMPVRFTVVRESAGGRIVYFSGNIEGLWRIDIGGNTAVAVPWMGPDPAFGLETEDCVGCHSFSGDGRRMSYSQPVLTWQLGVAEITSQNPAVLLPPAQGGIAVWTSMHPSGDWVLNTNLEAQVQLMEVSTGQVVTTLDTGAAGLIATQAVWSPRGDKLAFTAGTATNINGVTDVYEGHVWTMGVTNTATGTLAVGPAELLVGPDVTGGTAYYPSFSPDGEWVVFCRAPAGSSYANSGAKLWLAKTDGSVPPIALDNANMVGDLQNSWPRWAPTSTPGQYWILFSSTRAYPPLNTNFPQQLWVTRVDLSGGAAGDPSTPAIWLSGQDPFIGNLTAEWTIAR